MTRLSASVAATLGDFSLDVEIASHDDVLALVGPNGSGKTTLLRCIAGAVQTARTHIRVDGDLLDHNSSGSKAPIEQRRVGYVPQGCRLFPHLDVLDNVSFGLSVGPEKVARSARRARARDLLEHLGCATLTSRRTLALSGGELQRVALARALILKPRLLLLDEPLSSLDAPSRRATRTFLRDHLTRLDKPAIVVTHDVRDVEALASKIVVLDAGRVAQMGSLEDLRRAPASDFVAEFLGLPLD